MRRGFGLNRSGFGGGRFGLCGGRGFFRSGSRHRNDGLFGGSDVARLALELGKRGLLSLKVRAVGAVLLDEDRRFGGRDRPDAEPLVDPVTLQDGAGVGIGNHRVVDAELFKNAAVARFARVYGAKTEKRTVFASEHLQTNSDCQGFLLS